MRLRFSDSDASIVLGATLMHWGVPFRRAARHELTEHQQGVVDQASEKFISLKDSFLTYAGQNDQEVLLSDEEAALLIEVVQDCLNECGSDESELRLQLKTSERHRVEILLERLRVALVSGLAKLV
jgi:hypothetical protein